MLRGRELRAAEPRAVGAAACLPRAPPANDRALAWPRRARRHPKWVSLLAFDTRGLLHAAVVAVDRRGLPTGLVFAHR